MKTLLALTVFALSLGLSSYSYASSYIFGVQTPIKKNQVTDRIRGAAVENDYSSFYLNPKDRTELNSVRYVAQEYNKNNELNVFGVKIGS